MKLRDWLSTTHTTHAAFAERLDVSRETVSRWASETVLPDWKRILEIEKLTKQAVTAADWANVARERG